MDTMGILPLVAGLAAGALALAIVIGAATHYQYMFVFKLAVDQGMTLKKTF